MHDGVGDLFQHVRVDLDLVVEVAGDVGQVVERLRQAFGYSDEVGVGVAHGLVGGVQGRIQFLEGIGGDDPLAERTFGLAEVGGDDGKIGDSGTRVHSHHVEVRGQIGAVGQNGV